jgi:polar amino acid transport system substrate-binding protein
MSVFFLLLSFCLTLLSADFSHAIPLRWAADTTSGVPYVFVDPEHPDQMMGFEKDIMDAVATTLGKTLVVVQTDWESLVPGLDRGDYDVAANGIEITAERSRQVLFSIPYYATFEQIVVQKENTTITKLKDLNGKKVGTLKASLAHHILNEQTTAKLTFYEEENSGYEDVANGRLDSFFVDYPIALYYAQSNPKLKLIGDPVGIMTYGIAISKKNPGLLKEINHALQQLHDSGKLEEILAKWRLMHPFTVKELGLKTHIENDEHAFDQVSETKNKKLTFTERMDRYGTLMPLLLKGAVTTVQVSIASMILAILSGMILAIMRLYGNTWVCSIAQSWIEIIRGTPLLIQLYLIFFGLPHLGLNLSPFMAAVLGLGLNYGAYEAENYRAGIEAIPASQKEAAFALALSPFQQFFYVILPQAYRIMLPPMTNDFISLIKDSSLVSVITMVELTTVYSQLSSTYFDHLGLGILVAAIYFAIGYPFVRIARRLEKNLKKGR